MKKQIGGVEILDYYQISHIFHIFPETAKQMRLF
jgi:hypothetical protein